MMISTYEDDIDCPFCGFGLSRHNFTKFRVEGGEDEAKPFSILSEVQCPYCNVVVSVSRTYDFDKGLTAYSIEWK